MTFAGFTWLQRSAFSDPRVLAASAVTSAQIAAALAWAFAITGFALYLASFDTFENTYGTIGSGLVLLVWLTMFTMLYYVTPDFHMAGIASLGAGAALSSATWLVTCTALAVCVAAFAPLEGWILVMALGVALLVALWVTNIGVLMGVHLNSLGTPWTGADPISVQRLEPVSGRAREQDLLRAVGLALQNDVAHDGMVSPFAHAEEETAGMSDLELDLADWSFTYGVAWAVVKAQEPHADDDQVAARALAAAHEVFRLYCGEEDWEQRIRRQIRRRAPDGLVVESFDEAVGNGHGGYELLR
jgi:hypothetical protein